MGIFKHFMILLVAIYFLTAESRRLLPQNLRDLREYGNRCSSSRKSIYSPHKRILQVSPHPNVEKAVVPEEEILDFELPPEPLNSRHVEVSPDPNAEKTVVPEEEILDFELPPKPSNSRHVLIFVSAESRPLQPQKRELVERTESMKGGETKGISEAVNSKGPLDPVFHDPRHNKMNP